MAWHRREQRVVALCGVVPVAAVVPVFPADTYWHHRGTGTIEGLLLYRDKRYGSVVLRALGESDKIGKLTTMTQAATTTSGVQRALAKGRKKRKIIIHH